MLRLLSRLWLLPVGLTIGIAQTPSPGNPDHVDLAADKLVRTDGVLHGLGHVRAKLGAISFQADEAAARPETGEMELRGRVQATLPAREDRSLFRYGSGNLITDKPVVVHADRMSVKDGLLKASGNIVVRPVDDDSPDVGQVRADEMSMNLRMADGTLRGNIEPNYFLTRQPSLRVLPPDIVK